jgi:hypothetical protein
LQSKRAPVNLMALIMKLGLIALVIFAFAASAQAQGSRPQERQDQQQEAVLNEDGGRAFLIKPASTPLIGTIKSGERAVGDLQQHSIFLGSGWADPALRVRESRLSSLLVNIREQAQLDEISQAGIQNRFGPTFSIEKLNVPGNRNISDLEIQSVLAEMFANGPLTQPTADAVYVVFLDPGLRSTLGPLVAGKHYVAYHGFFSASGARVHYAVVPYQSDPQGAYQIALRSLVVAALNPTNTSSN